jgi:hypothetical protein
MREYTKTSPAIWQSTRFRSLPVDDDRFCFVYLLTNQHQNSAGCYALPPGYAATDLRWTPEKYRLSLAAQVSAGLIQVDPETDEVLIERWFLHNPPMNEKHRLGTERAIMRIKSPVLRAAALASLQNVWDDALQRREVSQSRSNSGQRAMLLPIGGQKRST